MLGAQDPLAHRQQRRELITGPGRIPRPPGRGGEVGPGGQRIRVRERVLGPEHPQTLAVRSNLARWTGQAGDVAGARDQYAALLPVSERVLGPEHPATLAARSNLARWTGEAGDAAGARDQFAAVLPVRERVSGPARPLSLIHI